MMTHITGSCLCGAVAYEVNSDFEMSGNCHCNTCKKITGSAFEAFAIVASENFALTKGEESLAQFKISPKAKKNFCAICGTPVFNLHRLAPRKHIVHIGTLDNPACVTPTVNLHCENMLPWVAEILSLNNFDRGFSR